MANMRARAGVAVGSASFAAVLSVLTAAACTVSERDANAPTRGEALFERHCAGCHGLRGDADTPVRPLLFPRPRAFRDGVFKLTSSQNGVPSDADLVATLRRGLPGSAMPSYSWMAEEDLNALAQHVRALAIEGMADQLQLRAAALGIAASAADSRREAERRMQPGAQVAPAASEPDNEENRERGHVLYRRHCAACHGEDLKGRTPDIAWAGAAEMQWPRDFTAGFMRGEATREALTHRIRAGMPGAGMGPTDLTDVEAGLLVDFLRSRLADGSASHHTQWRRTLRARRLADLPNDPYDPDWSDIEAVRIPLAPLWWRKDAVFEMRVRAVHDDDRLVFQLQWDDPSCDDRAAGGAPQGDGAAIQFTTDSEPPMFAMGGSEGVEIWHWKAFRHEEVAGGLDLLSQLARGDVDAPVSIPGVTQPTRVGEALSVHGPLGMTRGRGMGRVIVATPRWRDGVWTLVMSRGMRAHNASEIDIEPRQKLFVAFAAWNGSVDLHAASKSVSTWHALELSK